MSSRRADLTISLPEGWAIKLRPVPGDNRWDAEAQLIGPRYSHVVTVFRRGATRQEALALVTEWVRKADAALGLSEARARETA